MKLKTNFDFTKYFHRISGTPHNLVIAEVANISAKDMVIIAQISFNSRPVFSAISNKIPFLKLNILKTV